jgi:uncharacterized protein YbaP (TraB family)
MTNQDPLTAEAVAYSITSQYSDSLFYTAERNIKAEQGIEAYAAQEVAKKDKRIKELSAAEKAYCRNISLQEKQIKSLNRMLKLRDTKIEKLKAHIALMEGRNND